MLTDTRVINRHGPFEVLAECHPVVWPSNNTVALHLVRHRGVDQMFQRAIEHEPGHWIVVDLVKVVAFPHEFKHMVKSMPEADQRGAVMFSLRQEYPDAPQFLLACFRNFAVSWYVAPALEAA